MLMALRGDSEVAGTSWEKDTPEEGPGRAKVRAEGQTAQAGKQQPENTARGGEGGRSLLEQGEGGRARGGGGKEREARQG